MLCWNLPSSFLSQSKKCGPLILLKLTEVLGGLHNLDGAPFGWLDFNGTPKLNGIDGIPNDC